MKKLMKEGEVGWVVQGHEVADVAFEEGLFYTEILSEPWILSA